MNFLFFDKTDRRLFSRADATKAEWTEEEYKLSAAFPLVAGKKVTEGMRIGFWDYDGIFQAFEIRQVTDSPMDNTQQIEAEHVAVAELSDEHISKITPTNATPATAVNMALQGTEWIIGTTTETNIASAAVENKHAWYALCAIRDAWKVRISPRITLSEAGIVGRFIDISSSEPMYRGLRLTMRRNIQKAGVIYDDRNLFTAVYVYGKTVSTGSGEQEKITIADAVWSKAAGNPADKPIGQAWVEDVNATSQYGRKGRKRSTSVTFSDIEDPAELLQKGWEHLQTINKPRATFNITCMDLRAFGYSGEPLRLGDAAIVEIEPLGIKVMAGVTKLKHDLLRPEQTKPTIGDYRADIVYAQRQTASNAAQGAQIVKANPSLLNGYIDTMHTGIMSSKTNRFTNPEDGGDTYVTTDGNKAVHLTGAGILLASGKSGNTFNWRTAITGEGIVADEINTGTLRASLVTILGNSNFYWDAANIVLQNPSVANNQIRIGQYDGANLGIGFTRDGGATWNTAIGFGGAQFGATMAGWYIGDNGLYTANNALYLGVSPISTTIDGTSRSVILKAGNNFGVSANGDLYANSGFFGGNVYAKNIQVGSTAGYITGGQVGSRTITGNNLETLYATQAAFNSLQADVATIDQLLSGSATIQNLRVSWLNTATLSVLRQGTYRTLQLSTMTDGSGSTVNVVKWV